MDLLLLHGPLGGVADDTQDGVEVVWFSDEGFGELGDEFPVLVAGFGHLEFCPEFQLDQEGDLLLSPRCVCYYLYVFV